MQKTESGLFVGGGDELQRELERLIGKGAVRDLKVDDKPLVLTIEDIAGQATAMLSGRSLDEAPKPKIHQFLNGPIRRISPDAATAVTKLFISDWSTVFHMMHGPDAMLGVMPVVESLLKEGEAVTGVKNLQFRSIMQNELSVCAWNDENQPDLSAFGDKKKIVGGFEVSGPEGKRGINFIAFDTAALVGARASNNQIAQVMGMGFDSWETVAMPDGKTGKIFDVGPFCGYREEFDTGERLNTVMDIILEAVMVLKRKGICGLNPSSLLYNFTAEALPDEKSFKGSSKLKLTFDENLKSEKPSGFGLVSIGYEFMRGREVFARGIVTIAFPNNESAVNSLVRKLQVLE